MGGLRNTVAPCCLVMADRYWAEAQRAGERPAPYPSEPEAKK